MAAVHSWSDPTSISRILRHSSRDIIHSSNPDIDRTQSINNRTLSPNRDMRPFDYYKQRLAHDVYKDPRSNVITMSGWIITAPVDLKTEDNEKFFDLCYEFLNQRYGGEENCIQATVHRDESNKRGHLHYYFIPVKPDNKHDGYTWKCCKWKVLTPTDLRTFHPDLQKYLDDHGCHCSVYTGATKAQGGNRSVRELKRETKRKQWQVQVQTKMEEKTMKNQRLNEHDPDIERWNKMFDNWRRDLNERTQEQRREIERDEQERDED